jgi:hypothetical protein
MTLSELYVFVHTFKGVVRVIDKKLLKRVYKRYGFDEKYSSNDNVIVFSLMSGHFHNVDIIPLNNKADTESVFNEYKESGYACKVRSYHSIKDVERTLFKGFFSVDITQERLKNDYKKFTTSIVKMHSDNAEYSYIQSKYFVNDKVGEKNVISEIMKRLPEAKPVLFLIEAAAGFGKTCSAYELLNEIIRTSSDLVPLFSELSRNRQAKIFRYVLLDEIDRSFPLLSSGVVRAEIKNGNVPVILDGFDELLHESAHDGGYENTEPMLETIGELLQDNAKVILTTRRTAIFDGDNFHQWMNAHEDDFEIVRIRIQEPTIEEWLPADRIEKLNRCNFNITQLSNPVLLSFLRCIPDCEFNEVSNTPELIVHKFFDSMLERERIRQDLKMTVGEQYEVLKSIADDMIKYNYTAESREYIVSVISDLHHEFLEKIRYQYTVDERPTTDELANKLASHALLDRALEDEQGIGFVNEFVLGNFCAELIISHKTKEWSEDKRFIEPAVLSYIPRTLEQRTELWEALHFSFEFLDGGDMVRHNLSLINKLGMDIEKETVEGVHIKGITLGADCKILETIFIDCIFTDIQFDWSSFDNVTFTSSSFFNCSGIGDISDNIFVLGCDANNAFLGDIQADGSAVAKKGVELDFSECDIYILEKFWPKGRPSFIKHRPIKGLCQLSNQFSHEDILHSIANLKKNGYLLVPAKRAFLELNLDELIRIKQVLGRD